jgi:hypothetical protein
LEVERAELVDADDDVGIADLDVDGAVHQAVQVQNPVLLGLEVRVARLLPGLQALKRHALLAEQDPQALVAEVVDHPLGDQELRQLRQRPGRKRQVMVDGPGQGELLDRSALGQGEGRRPAAAVARVQRVEPVEVAVVQYVADPVGAGEGDLGDLGDAHAVGAEQRHLRPPPGHHRPGRPAHDAQQPVALLVADLPHADPLGHLASSRRPMLPGVSQPGERCRPRR